MYSEKMDLKLKRLKSMIKKATNKGGVKIAVEMADINQALKDFLDALNEDFEKRAEEEREAADEEEETEPVALGDVVICLPRAEEQAREYGHSREREIVYLYVHSVLHLLGYDHMEGEDKQEMRAREEEVMKEVDLQRQSSL